MCAIPGVNIETSWVMSVWLLALSVLRVNVRGLSVELLKPVETPQVQFSDKSVLDRALFLERILRRVGLRSHGVWRSECCESVFVGCRVDLLKPVEIPPLQFLDIYCGADRGRCHRS